VIKPKRSIFGFVALSDEIGKIMPSLETFWGIEEEESWYRKPE
jgi:hypothetical protein